MRILLLLPLLLLLFATAAPAAVTLPASTVQLPATGQIGCWDSNGNAILCTDPLGVGQDGAVRAGVDWSRMQRFTDNHDGTITDRLTGLVWLKDTICKDTLGGVDKSQYFLNWADSLAWTKNLANGNCGLSDGSAAGDWRVPNQIETASLYNYQQILTWLKEQGFKVEFMIPYWSSTTQASEQTKAFNFLTSSVKTGKGLVWPVRDDQGAGAITLPETGQFSCWDNVGNLLLSCAGTGQDGERRTGVAWPRPRFVDNHDGTVTDQLTGLIWLKDADCAAPPSGTSKLIWANALTWSNSLATGNCGLNDGSAAGDWRLPNSRELQSLINFQQSDSLAWLNSQGFSHVRDEYWSSTTINFEANPDLTAMAYTVEGTGSIFSIQKKDETAYTWPVRGGRFFTLTVNKAGNGSGSVTPSNGALIWNGASGTANYAQGTPVTLTATVVDSNSVFAGWNGACSGTGTCQVTMREATSVTATFNPARGAFAGQPDALIIPAGDTDGSYTVSWGASATTGATYTLEESTDSGFTANLRTAYEGSALSAAIAGRGNGSYYYRVKAGKSGLTDSTWVTGANACSVTLPATQPPAPPQLYHSVIGLTVTALWTSVAGADGYSLYYAPYPFTGPQSIGSIDMGSQTSISVNLWPGAAYYLAVKARNTSGESDFSNIDLFLLPMQ